MTGHISNVDKIEALLEGRFTSPLKGRYWGWRQTLQFVEGIKAAEVQRHIWPKFFFDPPAHGSHLFHVIILPWNHQIDNFSVNTQILQPLKCLQNRLKRSLGKISIVGLTKTLQVNAGSVQIFTQFLKGGPVDVPVGMHDLQDPLLLSKHANVDHVFGKDRGLYIGGCD